MPGVRHLTNFWSALMNICLTFRGFDIFVIVCVTKHYWESILMGSSFEICDEISEKYAFGVLVLNGCVLVGVVQLLMLFST